MVRVEMWDEASQQVVTTEIDDGENIAELLAEAATRLAGAHEGNPTVTLIRSDGSQLSLSCDGARCFMVWTNSINESAHSVSGQESEPDLIYDYFGSYGEALGAWTIPRASAIQSAKHFLEVGIPETDLALFQHD